MLSLLKFPLLEAMVDPEVTFTTVIEKLDKYQEATDPPVTLPMKTMLTLAVRSCLVLLSDRFSVNRMVVTLEEWVLSATQLQQFKLLFGAKKEN